MVDYGETGSDRNADVEIRRPEYISPLNTGWEYFGDGSQEQFDVTSTSSVREYVFRCPSCDTEIVVDAGARDVLLENACILCDTAVTEAAFTNR